MTTRITEKQLVELSAWMDTLPIEFIECRDVRHAWSGAQNVWRLGYGLRGRSLVCKRCGTQKEQVLAADGRVVASRMTYPDDYVKPADAPKGRVPAKVVKDVMLDYSDVASDVPPDPIVAIFDRIKKGMSKS